MFKRKREILSSVLLCDSFFLAARGLMFRRAQSALLVSSFAHRFAIHMLFVFFSIDVFWLDSQRRVVAVKRSVRPFSLYHVSLRPAQYVLEVPSSQRVQIEEGDVLDF